MNKRIIPIFLFSFISTYTVLAVESDNPLITDTVSISEVVVTGTRTIADARALPMTVSTINKNVIDNRREQSLLPIINELVPGFFSTSRGVMGYGVSTGAAGGMTMRGIGGSPTTAMLVLIDGHPQFMGLMGHPIADSYQSMIAEKVEVVRGPASMLYGSNAMGGVINIITNSNKEDGLHNNINLSAGSYNTLNAEIGSHYRKKRFYYNFNASYIRTDGHRDNMDFEQYGGYAKVGYNINNNWNIFADANITHFNASNPGTESKPIIDNDSEITRGMTSFSIDNSYAKTSGAIKLFYNWGEHTINDGYNIGDAAKNYLFNSTDNMFGVNIYQNISLFRGNKLTLGFDYLEFGGKARNLNNNGTKSELVDKSENNIAGYAEMTQSFIRFITLNAGIRYDYHSLTGAQLIPRFGATIHPFKSADIKLIASKGYRNPTIRELYMFTPKNPDLKPESLWNYEVSWSQRLFDGKLTYALNIYYIKGENMIMNIPVNGRPLNVNTGKIENKGLEVSASYKILKSLNFTANYSKLEMKNIVVAAPENKFYAGFDFRKNIFSLSTGVQYIKDLYTSVAVKDTSKEEFVLWNMRGALKFGDNLELYIKGENLLNTKYEINRGFTMPGTTVLGGINVKF